jgi:hypothetical protein
VHPPKGSFAGLLPIFNGPRSRPLDVKRLFEETFWSSAALKGPPAGHLY